MERSTFLFYSVKCGEYKTNLQDLKFKRKPDCNWFDRMIITNYYNYKSV